jgi:hypothetical protein
MDQLLRFAPNAFRHFIQDIGRLVNSATLLGDWAVFFLQSDPEAQRSVTSGVWARPIDQGLSCPSSSRQDWVLTIAVGHR